MDSVRLIVSQYETIEAERVAEEIMKLTGYGELVKLGKTVSGQTFDEKGQSTFLDDQTPGKDANTNSQILQSLSGDTKYRCICSGI